ncbi:MAG: single-stranded DNA-binding protein [Massiliimalia sp.]|jgi:single-strand DNA-binding protein
MLNHATLMGRLVADPDLKQTPNGVSVLSCCIAVDRDYNREQTDFINLVAWRQTAEFAAKYFKKGQLIAAEGAIQTRNYEDKEGKRRTAFEVVVDKFHFAEGKKDREQVPGPADYDAPPAMRKEKQPGTSMDLSIDQFSDYEELGDFEEPPF